MNYHFRWLIKIKENKIRKCRVIMMIKLAVPSATLKMIWWGQEVDRLHQLEEEFLVEELAVAQLLVALMVEQPLIKFVLRVMLKMWLLVRTLTTLIICSLALPSSSKWWNSSSIRLKLYRIGIKICQSVRYIEMKISRPFAKIASVQFALNVFWESTGITRSSCLTSCKSMIWRIRSASFTKKSKLKSTSSHPWEKKFAQ